MSSLPWTFPWKRTFSQSSPPHTHSSPSTLVTAESCLFLSWNLPLQIFDWICSTYPFPQWFNPGRIDPIYAISCFPPTPPSHGHSCFMLLTYSLYFFLSHLPLFPSSPKGPPVFFDLVTSLTKVPFYFLILIISGPGACSRAPRALFRVLYLLSVPPLSLNWTQLPPFFSSLKTKSGWATTHFHSIPLMC